MMGTRPSQLTRLERALERPLEARRVRRHAEEVVPIPVSAIKPYEGFGDVDHTIKELMSL
jgi:hypothetical protein